VVASAWWQTLGLAAADSISSMSDHRCAPHHERARFIVAISQIRA
jgi:hypothetical protein